jgi:hypothetical protein
MKKTLLTIVLVMAVLAANCQKKDQTFDVPVWFKAGFYLGADPTLYLTLPSGTGTVTWDGVLDKPLTFAPSAHNHDALYRAITWVPTFAQVTSKPTTLAGYGITDAASLIHTHSLLYKPLDYVPAWNDILSKPVFAAVATSGSWNDLSDVPEMMELEVALPSLPGIKLPVLTAAEIAALVPEEGLLLVNQSDTTLQVFLGNRWKVIITNK